MSKSFSDLLHRNHVIRCLGFDDVPFDKHADVTVDLAGVMSHDTRFEGMVWGTLHRDGLDSTQVIASLVTESKFADQIHVVLTDGVTFGGMNVLNLAELHDAVGVPCVSVMRRMPDMDAIDRVLERFGDGPARRQRMRAAGDVHEVGDFVFQVVGDDPEPTARILARLTDRGRVPEPLRLAHLIGSAVKLGQSGRRA